MKLTKKLMAVAGLALSLNSLANDGNAKDNISVDVIKNRQAIFDDVNDEAQIESGKKSALRKTATIFNYEDNNVYEIFSKPEFLTTIKLAKGEEVKFFAGGDTENWMLETTTGGKDNRTMVYIKPLDTGLKSNLVITTDKRTYYFNITSGDIYNTIVEFQYPNERKILLENFEKENEVLATDPENINMNYYISNKNLNFSPQNVYDDGEKTYIIFKNNLREIPTVLIKGEDGTSTLTDPKIKDRKMIIGRTAQRITLVLGKKNIHITNLRKNR